MAFTLDNFVRSILAVDAAIGDTSLVVALAAPPLRNPPAASAGAPGILILQDQPTAPTKIEIVTYTGVSIVGTQVTLTGVTRALEGTTAQGWPAGTQTFSGSTAAVLAQFATQTALAAVAASIPTTPGDIGAATAAQGAKADTAIQQDTWPELSGLTVTSASLWFDFGNGPVAIGDSATNPATAYATAAQGAKADSAVQPAGLAPYATLSGAAFMGNITAPNLGTAAAQNATAFATAAQGAKADAALPSAGIDVVAVKSIAIASGYFTTGGTWARFPYVNVTGDLDAGGNITAANLGAAAAGTSRTYVQSTDPGTVPDGSLWVW